MKIRDGFVSNSSSSSFILVKPKKYLPVDKVADFYGITNKFGEEFRDWASIYIWAGLNKGESYDSDTILEDYLSPSSIQWRRNIKYGDHTDEWYDEARKNQKAKEHVRIEVSNSYSDYEYDNVRLPFDVMYDLDSRSEELFEKPAKAIGISMH